MKKRYLLSLLLVLVLVVSSACGKKDEEPTAKEPDEPEMEMPEPDLEDLPDVVAEVNGEEITGEEFEASYMGEFQQAAFQAQMSGQEIDQDQLKSQVVEGLVGQKLLIQGADEGKFEASEDEINKTLEELAEQNQMESTDDLFAALEESGMTEDDVLEQIAIQIKIEQLIDSELGEIDTSDKALQEIYDDIKAEQEEAESDEESEFPSFDEAKEDLVQYVKSQKEAETVQSLVEKYRDDADITIHI